MRRPLGEAVKVVHYGPAKIEVRQIAFELEVRRPRKRELLRILLSDGRWHEARELEHVAGRRFGARLHELRRGDAEPGGWPPMAIARRRSKVVPFDFAYRALRPGEVPDAG